MDALFVNEKGGENRWVRPGFGPQIKGPPAGALKRADPHRGQPLEGQRRVVFRQFFPIMTWENPASDSQMPVGMASSDKKC